MPTAPLSKSTPVLVVDRIEPALAFWAKLGIAKVTEVPAAASAKLSTEELLALIRSGESARDADLGDDAAGDDEMPPADALGLDAGPRPSAQKGDASE